MIVDCSSYINVTFDVFNMELQLFLLKRGGQEIYVGPLGRLSCHLIKYFEVCYFGLPKSGSHVISNSLVMFLAIVVLLKSRELKESTKSKMVTIRLLGCWK